jgi:hypothetical protein
MDIKSTECGVHGGWCMQWRGVGWGRPPDGRDGAGAKQEGFQTVGFCSLISLKAINNTG